MAHRRVKDVGYDEDDLGDYSEEEYYGEEVEGEAAPSAEDEEQMRAGTISVRQALGETSAFVTDTEIQEALWHYYYDVGKSVTYLKSTHNSFYKSGEMECSRAHVDQRAPQQAQPPKETKQKQKQTSKFDEAAAAAAQAPAQKKNGESAVFLPLS